MIMLLLKKEYEFQTNHHFSKKVHNYAKHQGLFEFFFTTPDIKRMELFSSMKS